MCKYIFHFIWILHYIFFPKEFAYLSLLEKMWVLDGHLMNLKLNTVLLQYIYFKLLEKQRN